MHLDQAELNALIPICRTERQREIVQSILDNGGILPASKKLKINKATVARTLRLVRDYGGTGHRITPVTREKFAGLEQFATVRQLEYLDLIEKHGNATAAEKVAGVAAGVIRNSLRDLQKKAARRGIAPDADMIREAAPGFRVKGTSTLYDKEGNVAAQWVKTTQAADEAEEAMRRFVEDLAAGIEGAYRARHRPKHADAELLALYPMGDPHIGMFSWSRETGEDFNLEIAERQIQAAIDRLVASAPPAETGVLLNLGDMLHADNQSNTTRSGHQLDVDGRWTQVIQIGLRSMVYCIDRMLARHKQVIVRINRGNHDDHSAFGISMMLDSYYRHEPRVTVDLTPGAFWFHRFGRVLIGSCHGDTAKGPALPGIMAADRAEDWGLTRHRYWYVGHVHHHDAKEYAGAVVEYFRTLAAKDAWHTAQGYRAGRDMRLIVLHAEHGEIERHRCDVGMLQVE